MVARINENSVSAVAISSSDATGNLTGGGIAFISDTRVSVRKHSTHASFGDVDALGRVSM
jgi:hypothetical protein